MNEFETRWATIGRGGHAAGRFRVYPDHVVDFYVQYSLAGLRELVIELHGEQLPDFDVPTFKNIDVVKVPVAGGVRIGMTLLHENLTRSFSVMCYDLAERTKAAASIGSAAGMLIGALQNWADLLKQQQTEGLSREETLGLLGEMLVIEALLQDTNVGPDTLIQGWRGPGGDSRDIGIGGQRVEVKTQRSTAANRLRISSLAQLDDRGDSVYLVAMRVGPLETGRSLVEICEQLRKLLSDFPFATLEFERTIALSGMDPEAPLSLQRYEVDDRLVYAVTDQFPRLVPSNVPNGIVAAQYEVGGPAVDACRTDWETLVGAING